MNKSVLVGVVALVVVLAGGGLLLANRGSDNSENSSSTGDSSSMNMNKDSSADTSSASSSEATATNAVEIKDYAFSPATITVKKGTKVTWTNQDSVQHDVMSDKTDVAGPSSELLAKGQSYSYTFDTPGTYTYHCSPHPYMKAKVIVTE